MTMISVVSAYVPIPGHPRPLEEFHQLGCRLMEIRHPVLFTKDDVERCWLYEYLATSNCRKFTHSVADNPQKNSLNYHIVMAQKTEWLETAATVDPSTDVFVWIDLGIFHVPGITPQIIDDFLDRAEGERAIAIPGCWSKDDVNRNYDDQSPCWRFCGGVMVVPRRYVKVLNMAMKQEYVRWIKETGNISWEVNTLARLEQRDEHFPVWWYEADHNQTLFTNYRGNKQHEDLH
jgi:hypothetical protein